MTEIILNETIDDARTTVIEAFDRTEGITKFQKSQHQVVGETGVSFPRILWSYGESVYVDLSETGQVNKTKLQVRGEKEVPINVGANPEKYKRRFLDELDTLRDKPTATSNSDNSIPTAAADGTGNVRSEESTPINAGTTNVSSSREPIPTADPDPETMEEGSGNGTSTLMIIIGVSMLLFFGMWFLMMISMPY